MNNLIDYVNRWAAKLTYRIMKTAGVSQGALNKFLQAIRERNEDVIKADIELSKQVPKARFYSYIVIFLSGMLIYWVLIDKRR